MIITMKYVQIILILLLVVSMLWWWHVAVYYAIKSSIQLTLVQSQWLSWWLVWLTVSFVVMSMIVNTIYSQLWSRLYTASAVWLGTLYWLVIVSIIIVVLIWLNKLLWWILPIAIIGKLLLVIAVGISIYGVRNSAQTKIVSYTVAINNLPSSWEGRKIAMIADTHVWAIRNIWLLRRIRLQIEAQWVKMLLVAGDYWDGPKANDEELAQALWDITTTFGTFFAPGNHEEYWNLNNYIDYLTQAWVRVLNNQITIVDWLQIIGVNYSDTGTASWFAQTLAAININSSQPSILIKHVPNHLQVVDEYGIDLQVAWHVHQWQVRPWYRFARRVFGIFSYGLNQIGQSWIITSSGVGTWWPPQRVGTHSEIIVITLIKK